MSVKAWPTEKEQELIDLYMNKENDVYQLATYFNTSHRSVISKLVQLKIYSKPDVKAQKKERTVKVMLRVLEKLLNIKIEGTNLNKKSNLKNLVEAIEKAV